MKKLFRRLFPRKEMRAYLKMHHKHRKELIKLAKEFGEWDWIYLHRFVMTIIKHFHEYYSAGNNVWQSDETLIPIIEQLKHILDLDKEIEKVVDEGLDVEYIEKDGKITAVFPNDFIKIMNENEEKEQQLYEELYSSIGKNLQQWWD